MQRGWEAAKRWAWEEARAAFQESVNDCETPEALEGLGTAALWLDDVPAALRALERAYRLYRDAGDDEAGARVAATIADGLLTFRGEPAVAAGWLARARSCLRGDEGAPIAASIDALEAFLAMARKRTSPARCRWVKQPSSEAAAWGRRIWRWSRRRFTV